MNKISAQASRLPNFLPRNFRASTSLRWAASGLSLTALGMLYLELTVALGSNPLRTSSGPSQALLDALPAAVRRVAFQHADPDLVPIGLGVLAILATLRVALSATGRTSQPSLVHELAEEQWRTLVRIAMICLAGFESWRVFGYLMPLLLLGLPADQRPPLPSTASTAFCILAFLALASLTATLELRSLSAIDHDLHHALSHAEKLAKESRELLDQMGVSSTGCENAEPSKTSQELHARYNQLWRWHFPRARAFLECVGIYLLGAGLGGVYLYWFEFPHGSDWGLLAMAVGFLWEVPVIPFIGATWLSASDTSQLDLSYSPTARAGRRWLPRMLLLAGVVLTGSLILAAGRAWSKVIPLGVLWVLAPVLSWYWFHRAHGKRLAQAAQTRMLISNLHSLEVREEQLKDEAEQLRRSPGRNSWAQERKRAKLRR